EQGQLTTILLQHDLCRIAVLAGLVLPFACLELPFEVNLRTLLEILLGDLCKILVEDDDAVPFGALAPLAASFVTPALARCHAQIDDGTAILGVADFRIGAEIAHQYDLVDRSSHLLTSMKRAKLARLTLPPAGRSLLGGANPPPQYAANMPLWQIC